MKKKFCALFLAACLLTQPAIQKINDMYASVVYADNGWQIGASTNSPKVGDTLKIDLTSPAGTGKMVLNYSSTLQFSSCTATSSNSGRTLTVSSNKATVTFSVVGGGSTELILKDGNNKNQASAVLKVSGGSSDTSNNNSNSGNNNQNQTQNNNQTQTQTPAQTQLKSQFVIDGVDFVASEKFKSEEIPASFDLTKVRITDYDYKALSNGLYTLVYLKPLSNVKDPGEFYIYDTAAGAPLEKMQTIGDIKGSYFLLASPESLPNDNMEKEDVDVAGKTVSIYAIHSDTEDRYFGYGCDNKKVQGWFEITPAEGKFVKMEEISIATIMGKTEDTDDTVDETDDTDNTETEVEPEEPEKNILQKIEEAIFDSDLLFGITIAAIILVFLLLILNARRSGKDDDDEDDDEEEYEEDEPQKMGFFARRRREKNDEKEWQRMAEMDLDEYSSELKNKVEKVMNGEDIKEADPIEEVKATEAETVERPKAPADDIEPVHRESHKQEVPADDRDKKDFDFMDLNDL